MHEQAAAGRREIERKFLVTRPPDELDAYPSEELRQGYLAVSPDGVEVRIRKQGDRATLTVKSSGGLNRLEETIDIDERRFLALWPLTQGRRIHKTRYELPAAAGLVIELDVYAGELQGLMTAEVEFPSEAESRAFTPPGFLGAEVTEDPRYRNKTLALQGKPPADGG
jgi:CYTH domain-containing protein